MQRFNELFSENSRMIAADLNKLTDHCKAPYHNESDFICYEWKKSFLTEDGTDPLKYIYIFKHHGDVNIARHWHYIGLGLSDIHGYTRFSHLYEMVKEKFPSQCTSPPLPDLYPPPAVSPNGFGFELTFRLKCNSDDEWNCEPPSWPRKIMQDLARYVFQSRNTFNVGDHVAWHSALDSTEESRDTSRIKHILMTLDKQLLDTNTSMGPVKFIQIVGVCDEELQAAREWNVRGILDIMSEREDTGGLYLITDMRRGETIFDLNSENHDRLDAEICRMGSDMAQISDKHRFSYTKPTWFVEAENADQNDEDLCFGIEKDAMLPKDDIQDYPARTPSRMSQGSESALKIENADLNNRRYHHSIYILLSLESAKVLPIMLNGRLAHKRPFSFQRGRGDSLITFLPEGSPVESLVSPQHIFVQQAHWLQIYVSNALREKMFESIKTDFARSKGERNENIENAPRLPKNYSWPEHRLYLTVFNEIPDEL